MRFFQLKRVVLLTVVSFLLIQGSVTISAAHNPEQTEAKIIVANDKSNQPAPSQIDENSADNQVGEQVEGSPLMFIENVGQFDEQIHFQVRGQQGTFYFANDAVWLTVLESSSAPNHGCFSDGPHFPLAVLARMGKEACVHNHAVQQQLGVNLKLSFMGANPNPRIVGFDPLDTAVSYFIGNNPDNWHTNVPVYAGVRYEDVYPGVDVEYVSLNGQWQAQLVAKPWADLSAVAWQVEGADTPTRQFADGLSLVDDNRLHVETAVGDIELPLLLIDETKTPIQPKPSLHSNQIHQPFTTVAQNQQTAGATSYRTYLGGSADDIGLDIAVDDSGAAYVVGITWSADFHPVITNTLQGSTDIFIAKLNPDGSDLVYAAYLGGSGHECDTSYGQCAAAIAIAGNGSAYLTGSTWSTDFPTPNGLYTNLGGDVDAFVSQLNATGNQLLYGTYLGGSQPAWGNVDYGRDIAIDSAGYIYVTGETWSSDFPQLNPVKTTPNDETDAFVTKLTPTGDGLIYSTYLGGNIGVNAPSGAYDYGNGIAVDDAGNAYVTGWTASEDLLTGIPVSLQATLGGASGLDHCREEYWCPDAFVIKLGPGGEAVYGTYLGEPGWDEGRGITVHNNEAYVTGISGNCGWGGCDAPFVTRLNASGSGIIYQTQINGSQEETSNAIAVDSAGDAYITGHTKSNDFPVTTDAFQSAPGNPSPYNQYDDAFLVKLDASGEQVYGTYLGGSHYDFGYGLAVNASGVYVTGETWSTDFPFSPSALQTNHGGGLRDAFASRFDIGSIITETLTLEVIDANGNDVTGLTLNAEGWPISNTAHLDAVANPLTVQATLYNDSDQTVTYPFEFNISFSGSSGRFLVFDVSPDLVDSLLCYGDTPGDKPGGQDSYDSYMISCLSPGLTLLSGQSQTFQWQVWVQPSDAAQMQIQAAILGMDTVTKQVDIPQAAIHPTAFMHGILGSMPPANSVITEWPQQFGGTFSTGAHLDPFIGSYNSLIDNLLKMGYELNETLFPVTYDWRQSNVNSAAFLRQVLADNVGANGASVSSLPYVNPDGKADLIVHSMGGMVLRSYIQGLATTGDPDVTPELPYQHNVNKAVFIASPHRGFPFDYKTWEDLNWGDYFQEAAIISGDGLLGFLFNNLLWPYLILERYEPEFLADPCALPWGAQDWSLVRVEVAILCPDEALYYFSHSDPFDATQPGIGSLREMLPDANVSFPYLMDAGGPYPYSQEENYLLETLGLNDPASLESLQSIGPNADAYDNIYVLFNNQRDTVISYTVTAPPPPGGFYYPTLQRWPYGEIAGSVMNESGDGLIPEYSARLDQGISSLLALPDIANQELLIADTGHVLIAGETQTQQVIAAILTGIQEPQDASTTPAIPFASPYRPPVVLLNNTDVILSFLVFSPVDILVTDPLGRSVGYEPSGGQIINDIPGAYYTGIGSDVEFLLLPGDLMGDYTITTTGIGDGDYTVAMYRTDVGGIQLTGLISGTTELGQINIQPISYNLTTTLLFQDDMENGPDNWIIDTGWGLSANDAHSPVTAWASDGDGILPVGITTTLTLSQSLDLTAARRARLTYWFSATLSAEAEAILEISSDGGQSWQVKHRLPAGTWEWQPRFADLTTFTGSEHGPLQLRFRLVSANPADRWLLDDVAVELVATPDQFRLPFMDDFEGWRRWDGDGGFARTTTSAHSPDTAWYGEGDGATLTLAGQLDLTEAINPTLRFWHRLADGETGLVEISVDNGGSWTIVDQLIGTGDIWQAAQVGLEGFTGQWVSIRFRLASGGTTVQADDFPLVSLVGLAATLALSGVLAIGMVGGETAGQQQRLRWPLSRRRTLGLLFLILVGLWWWKYKYPHTIQGQNRLDDVVGDVELILGAEHGVYGAAISPDGRWLATHMHRTEPIDTILVDLEAGQYYKLKEGLTSWPVWLNENLVTTINGTPILRLSDFAQWRLNRSAPDSLEPLAGAEHIFVLEQKLGRDTFLTADPEIPYFLKGEIDELASDLADFPYTIVSADISDDVDKGRRGYSPDKKYYIQETDVFSDPTSSFGRQYEAMFDAATGQEIAHAYKWGWYPKYLGWAPDSSGVYLLFRPRGEYLDTSKENHPIFKLLVPGATPGPQFKEAIPPTPPPLSTAGVQAFMSLPDNQQQVRNVLQVTAVGWYIDDVRVEDVSSGTPTPTATATNTPSPTNTPTATPTNTATSTPLPTATNTPLPTATNTPLPTATSTPLATATNTPLPTATDTPLPSATPTNAATSTPVSTPTATATSTCNLYPIALNASTVATATPGEELEDILNGAGSGNFGWLTWSGNNSINTLINSLTPPGDSYSYVNPYDPADNTPSVGDWVNGRPGTANSKQLRQALDNLMPLIITVPVWNQVQGQGNNIEYQISSYAQVQISSYHLPGQDRISVVYWGAASCP